MFVCVCVYLHSCMSVVNSLFLVFYLEVSLLVFVDSVSVGSACVFSKSAVQCSLHGQYFPGVNVLQITVE